MVTNRQREVGEAAVWTTPSWEWFKAHERELDRHAGKWVAIGPEGLVGVGTCDEAFEQAAVAGVHEPLIHFVKDPARRDSLRVPGARVIV